MSTGTTTDLTRGDVTTGDPRSECSAAVLTSDRSPGEWFVVKKGKRRWAVRYEREDGWSVPVADWLDEGAARKVAAAPKMLAALEAIAGLEEKTKADCIGLLKQARHIAKCVISEATGAAS